MVPIEGEITIARPPEAVFDFVADERNEPRFNPKMKSVEQLSPGPIGRGTRFRAEVAGRGRPLQMVIEFTGFERPRRLCSSTRMPAMDIHGTLSFDPVPGGTRMRWQWELAPRGLSGCSRPWSCAWAGARKRPSGPASSGASRSRRPAGRGNSRLRRVYAGLSWQLWDPRWDRRRESTGPQTSGGCS